MKNMSLFTVKAVLDVLLNLLLSFEKFCFFTVLNYFIKRQSCHHIETSQLICSANQLTGFNMMLTLAFNELSKS